MRCLTFLVAAALLVPAAHAQETRWQSEWPNTDFSQTSIDLNEIFSGGPPKDGIPSIDAPVFAAIDDVDLADIEPVISLAVGGEAKAYPLQILMWHEIVNDEIGGVPVAVTFCPLCNAAIVFDRRVAGQALDFGTTGKLRYSDLVMYDRQTESWWQQFLGEAIVGELTGTLLDMLPARLESFSRFRERHPGGLVQVPNNPAMRAYGRNPYANYDSSERPFLYRGDLPDAVAPLSRVVRVGDRAWSLRFLREAGDIETADLHLRWQPGQASALDSDVIAEGRDVGNVVVEERVGEGWQDAVYSIDFAFAFHAFHPDVPIIVE